MASLRQRLKRHTIQGNQSFDFGQHARSLNSTLCLLGQLSPLLLKSLFKLPGLLRLMCPLFPRSHLIAQCLHALSAAVHRRNGPHNSRFSSHNRSSRRRALTHRRIHLGLGFLKES